MAKEIALEDFNHLKVTIEMEEVLKKYGRLARDALKTNPSENPRIKEHRTENEYFKTWQTRYDKGSKTAIVYNKKNGRLTYLLENGHAKVNGGRVAGIPHIKPAELNAEKELLGRVKVAVR